MIILDFGSGNTCKNKISYVKNMYDRLKDIDTKKHEIVVKWQLFKRAGKNIPLDNDIFSYAYKYGTNIGYQVTASVFDIGSLNFLLNFDIPFVKIANNRRLDFLINYIPKNIDIYMSSELPIKNKDERLKHMWCISKYPADESDYLKLDIKPGQCISDHTENFNIFKKLSPSVIEWHYKLKYSTGLDSGSFARTPEKLMEVL